MFGLRGEMPRVNFAKLKKSNIPERGLSPRFKGQSAAPVAALPGHRPTQPIR